MSNRKKNEILPNVHVTTKFQEKSNTCNAKISERLRLILLENISLVLLNLMWMWHILLYLRHFIRVSRFEIVENKGKFSPFYWTAHIRTCNIRTLFQMRKNQKKANNFIGRNISRRKSEFAAANVNEIFNVLIPYKCYSATITTTNCLKFFIK